MATVSIHLADRSDAADLAGVYRSAYQENRELGFPAKAETVGAETVAEWINQYQVFVASVEGEIVGGVRLEETDSDRIKLSRLGVHADWKANGIGSELLDHAETIAQSNGYRTIWLTTPEDHPFLFDFYRSRGYHRTAEYPLEYRDYDEVILEKPLSS